MASQVKKGLLRTDEVWAMLLHNACKAGRMAAAEAAVAPMTVVGSGGESWRVPDGPCGFAWVNVRGDTAFARWLRRKIKGGLDRAEADAVGGSWSRDEYHGGYGFWVWHGNQSLARKEAYAWAMAKCLTEGGVPARAGSRLD